AARAVGILDAYEHRGALGHGAERGADRLLDGRAKDMRFDSRQARRAHLLALGKGQAVMERILELHDAGAPWRILDAWPIVGIVLRRQLAMIVVEAGHGDHRAGTGAAVAVVLAEMQDDAAARDLGVERRIVVEAMVPVPGEAEKIDIEFARFLD